MRMSSIKLAPSGKEIKKLLIDKELTQKALAAAMGVSVLYVRDICADHRKAHEMRKRIGQYLGYVQQPADGKDERNGHGMEINREFHEALGLKAGGAR